MLLGTLTVAANRRQLLRLAAALFLVRFLAHVPLLSPAPGLHRLFLDEPLLAVLDVFTGGALAGFSVMALGVYPFLVGQIAARFTFNLVRDAWDQKQLDRRIRGCTGAAAIVLGGVFLYVTARLGSGHTPGALAAVADIASLAAAAQLFVWLGRTFLDADFGIPLLVAANVFAALPQYLLNGVRSAKDLLPMAIAFAMAVSLQVFLRMSTRKIPVQWLKAPQKTAHTTLPLSLDASGALPLLYVLAGTAVMRLGGFLLADARMHWIRRLAAIERALTDVRTPGFWVALFFIGAVFKTAFDYARSDPKGCAHRMRVDQYFIPGVRPGRRTEDYLKRVSLAVALDGSILAMLPVAALGAYATRYLQAGLWPLLLIPFLYTVNPVADFVDHLRAAALTVSYDGLMPRTGRIRGRRDPIG